MTSALFKQAIKGSHTRVARIEVWDSADRLVKKSIAFTDGTVEETDVTSGPRAKLTVNIPATEAQYLRMGVELRPWVGVNLGSGPLEMYAIGRFPSFKVSSSSDPTQPFQLSLDDRWQFIQNADFTQPEASVVGMLVRDQIARLIVGSGGFTTVNVTATSTEKMTDQTWDVGEGSRSTAIANLCEAIGAQAGIDREGVPYVRNRPTLAGSAAVTYADGEGGTRISWSVEEDAGRAKNSVTFYCSNPDPANTFEPYTTGINDPASPAYFRKIGRRSTSITDPNVTTPAGAKAAAEKMLTRFAAFARQHAITALADVERQPGQTIGVTLDDGTVEKAMILTVTHPLTPDGAQQITTVNTRSDEDSGL